MSEEVVDDAVSAVEPDTEASSPVTLEEQGEIAADYIEGLLDIIDVGGDIDITVEGDRALVSVVEDNSGELAHLVGEEGSVLTALQDLTRLAVTNQIGQRSRLTVDVAGRRAAHKARLEQIARDAGQDVIDSGEPARLSAMSAFERKVVHDAVAGMGLRTESEGAEPNRYVVVHPAE